MDPPKELTVLDVTEDVVTINWIKPLAPFEYYKLSYQSARGNSTVHMWCGSHYNIISCILTVLCLNIFNKNVLCERFLPFDERRFGQIDALVSLLSPAGRVDSVMIDSDVTNYTLSSLFPATEYEISLSAVRGSQESKVVSTSVFTGRSFLRLRLKKRRLISTVTR